MPETATSNQPDALRPGLPPADAPGRARSATGAAADTGPIQLPKAREDAPPYTGPLVLPLTDAWLDELMRSGSAPAAAPSAPLTGLERQVTVPRTARAIVAVRPRGSSLSRRIEQHGGVLRVMAASLIVLALLGAALVIRGDVGVGRRAGIAVPPVGPVAAPASPADAAASVPTPAAPGQPPAAQLPSPGSPAAGEPPTAQPGPAQQQEPATPTQPEPAQPQPAPPPDAGPPPAAPGPPVIVRQSASPGQIQAQGCPVDHARIEAVISSESGLTSVRLFWADSASGTVRVVPMSNVRDAWVARIGPVEAAGTVYWKIDVRDAQNRLTTGPAGQLPVRAC